jgi:hypothetical protein
VSSAIALRRMDVPPRKRYVWEGEEEEGGEGGEGNAQLAQDPDGPDRA